MTHNIPEVLFTVSPDRMKAPKGQVLWYLFPFTATSLVPTMAPRNMVDT